jgi:hypothetical protein
VALGGVRVVGETVGEEEQVSGGDLEDYKGFIEFMAQSFYRPLGETDYFAGQFRDLLWKRSDISENDKIDIAFELGRLEYALYILKRLYKDGPLGEYLDRPDVVKRFIKTISPVMGLYVIFKDGKTEDIHKMLMTIGGASGDIYNIIRDGLEEIENERC